jgi:hypothetical protein
MAIFSVTAAPIGTPDTVATLSEDFVGAIPVTVSINAFTTVASPFGVYALNNDPRVRIAGTNKNETINASLIDPAGEIAFPRGNNIIFGFAGDDTIFGGAGADIINGGSGDDSLVGGSGADTIVGGLGADVLTGGSGADVFVFAIGDSPANAPTIDVITDFAVGVDQIDVPFAPGTFGGAIPVFGTNPQNISNLFGNPQIATLLAFPTVNFIQVNVLDGAIPGSYLIFDSNNDGVFNGTPNAAGVVDDIISLGGLLAAPLTVASFV